MNLFVARHLSRLFCCVAQASHFRLAPELDPKIVELDLVTHLSKPKGGA